MEGSTRSSWGTELVRVQKWSKTQLHVSKEILWLVAAAAAAAFCGVAAGCTKKAGGGLYLISLSWLLFLRALPLTQYHHFKCT